MSLGNILKQFAAPVEEPNDIVGRLYRKAINTRQGSPIKSDCFRPSQLHWTCSKQFVFNYFDPCLLDNLTPENYLATSIGTEIHSIIQNKVLGPLGVLTGSWNTPMGTYTGEYDREKALSEYIEPVFRDETYRLSGKVDGFISLDRLSRLEDLQRKIKTEDDLIREMYAIPFGEPTLFDIKTTKAEYFQEHKKQIPAAYQVQANLYMYLAGVKEMIFFYINKNDGATFTKKYKRDENVLSLALKKITLINNAIVDKKLPDIFSACTSPEDSRAKKCPFKDICFDALFDFDAWVANRELENAKKGIVLPIYKRIEPVKSS